jgi:poly-gamma-glutamate synthesis protein (capsule biosynthesis protein)
VKQLLVLLTVAVMEMGILFPDAPARILREKSAGERSAVTAAVSAGTEGPAQEPSPAGTGVPDRASPLPPPENTPAARGTAAQAPKREKATETPLPNGEKKVTLTFTGDVTLGSEDILRGKPDSFDSVAAREGYGWFFRNMQDLFTADDLTVVNLAGTLTNSSLMEDTGKTFRFRGPTDFAKILTESSIEACAISNNHIMDFGRQGYDSTMAALSAEGILYCGNDHSFVLEKDGIKIGFFALGSTYVNTYASYVVNTIARMRKEGVNAIVICFHAGQEYSPRRRSRDQEFYARTAVEEWGADLVIMHHPHVVQGVDILKNRYVFYSLGNFCFGGNSVIRASGKDPAVRALESMVVQMDLRFSAEGEYLGQSGRIYPCFISSSAEKAGDPNDFQPKLVFGEDAQGVLKRIQFDTLFDLGELNREGILELPFLENGKAEEKKE